MSKKKEEVGEVVQEKPVEKAVKPKKVSIELIIPISVNGQTYAGTITTEDHGLAELLIEMHERARAAKLQEQVGKVNEVLKIGGRLVVKEVK